MGASVVMPLALKDLKRVFFRRDCADAEDDSVFLINAYTPPAAEVALKRFGIADAGRSIAVDALKKQIDALERLGILSLPVKIFFPGTFMPDLTHEQAPQRQAVRARKRFGGHPCRGRGVRVRVCCLRSRRGRLLLQRAVYHVGGIAV